MQRILDNTRNHRRLAPPILPDKVSGRDRRHFMKRVLASGALFASIFLAASAALAQGAAPAAPPPPPLILSTTSFTDGGVIPDKYTQASPNPVSPALSWINTPAGTQSFTLIMHDPDGAPRK